MEQSKRSPEKTVHNIEQGADADLLALFGYSPNEAQNNINELRSNVLAAGYYTQDQIDPTQMVGVVDHGEKIYPGFQFDPASKQPRPVVQKVNALFLASKDIRNWEIAMWWITSNGYLDGITPAEAIGTPFEPILESAAKEELDL